MKFMDAHDMDIRSPLDGRIIPFDIYNVLYRNEPTPPLGVIPPSALQRRRGDTRAKHRA